METLWVLVAAVVGVIAGAVLGFVTARKLLSSSAGMPDTAALVAAESTMNNLRVELAGATVRSDELAKQNADLKAQLAERDERARQENQVLTKLEPVSVSLKNLQDKVAELDLQRADQHREITEQMKTTQSEARRLATTTERLTTTLAGNSSRGRWGEAQLERVLEASGLKRGLHFTIQTTLPEENKSGRPDATVNLPGGMRIAIDAKVPFNAYFENNELSATATADEIRVHKENSKKHVTAMKKHIKDLHDRKYWEGFETSPDLVVAYIPFESLLAAAVETDPDLLVFAFNHNVALVSPSSIWSLLQSVALSWRQEGLTENAKELFKLSKELHSRLSTMAGHLDALGKNVGGTVNSYNALIGSLERNVMPQVARMAEIRGEDSALNPRIVEGSPRELNASKYSDAEELSGQVDVPLQTDLPLQAELTASEEA
jgi:DNA recombination protein RmuC